MMIVANTRESQKTFAIRESRLAIDVHHVKEQRSDAQCAGVECRVRVIKLLWSINRSECCRLEVAVQVAEMS